MAPKGAEPFHMGLKRGIACETFKRLENVDTAHLLNTPEQVA